MKTVSYKVAKAIKEAGYPQVSNSPCYITEDCTKKYDADYDGDMPIIREREYKEGQYINVFTYNDKECNPPRCYAPTYLEVWLWLWREKNIQIEIVIDKNTNKTYPIINDHIDWIFDSEKDPKEVIIAAIEHLVDDDLIK